MPRLFLHTPRSTHTLLPERSCHLYKVTTVNSCVADPFHFDTDLDLRIRFRENREAEMKRINTDPDPQHWLLERRKNMEQIMKLIQNH